MCEGEIKVERQRDRMCSRIKLHSTDTDKVGSRRSSKAFSDLLYGALASWKTRSTFSRS